MYNRLSKSLVLMILIAGSLFPLSSYGSFRDFTKAASEDVRSVPEDTLLRALKKAKNEVPSNDLIFLQFKDAQALEKAVKIIETLNVPILYRYQLLPLLLVDKLTSETLKLIIERCSIVNIHPNKEHTLIRHPDQLIALSSNNGLNSSHIHEIIGANMLLEDGYNGSGITIAILDTGVDDTHPDLVGKIDQAESFVKVSLGYLEDEDPTDNLGHGTGVAGTAAGIGKASNGLYMGIAPGARLWNVKVLNTVGSGRDSGIVAGIEYATFGPNQQRDSSDPDIINLSLGGPGGPDDLSSLAVDAAVAQGVVVTASAGNEGPFYTSIGSPGAALQAITVGATKLDGTLAKFSSRGFNLGKYPDPDIVAPGQSIISPLSANSFLGRSHEIRTPASYIRGNGGNYIALSGTSLSSPVVAGACALLLEAFPSLNDLGPIALRIALMRTANQTHQSFRENPNLGGAGALDVENAAKFLKNLGNSPEHELIFVFPNILFSPPAFVAFPGNHFEHKVLLLSASPGTFELEIDGSIKDFAKLDKTTINLDKGDVIPINLAVSIPLDINPTLYESFGGFLNVQMNGELIASLPFQSIELKYPKLRVYFDNFHNRGSGDTPSSNFFAIAELLRNNSIDVVVHDSFISSELLASFDVLLLPDVEVMFSTEELQVIHQFIENGGNLVVLGAEKDSVAAESINELLDPFGITFTDTIEFAIDQGVQSHHEENLNVTDLSPHPLLQNISSFTWKAGIGLKINQNIPNTRSIATIDLNNVTHTVLALHAARSQYQGNLIVLGTDYLFYDDLLNETGNDNQLLAENIFEWFTPDYEILPIMLTNRTRAAPGNAVNILTYTLDSKTFTPISVDDLELTITFPNGTEVTLAKQYAKAPFELIPGIYRYIYTLPANIQGHLIFRAYSSQLEETLSTTIYALGTEPRVISIEASVETGGRDINTPDWIIFFDEPQLDRYGDKIIFDANVTDANQVTLYLTLLGSQLSEFSEQPSASYVFPMERDIISQHWRYEWVPNSSIPAGMYTFFVLPATKDGLFPLTTTNSTGTFILLDSEPILDKENTFLNGDSIQELDELLDEERIRILGSSTISVEIVGEDLEDSPSELDAWVIVTELSLFIIDEEILSASPIPYNPRTQKFEANITLSEDIFRTSRGALDNDVILTVFFVLRDSDGNYGEELVATALSSGMLLQTQALIAFGLILMGSLFFIDPLLGTIVFFLGISLIVWFIFERLRK
ncbi:MAG: S8 family serine peptidase [Promethearchaeota archaeon]